MKTSKKIFLISITVLVIITQLFLNFLLRPGTQTFPNSFPQEEKAVSEPPSYLSLNEKDLNLLASRWGQTPAGWPGADISRWQLSLANNTIIARLELPLRTAIADYTFRVHMAVSPKVSGDTIYLQAEAASINGLNLPPSVLSALPKPSLSSDYFPNTVFYFKVPPISGMKITDVMVRDDRLIIQLKT
ncbi:MAG: hypothetical protein ACOX0E_10425 [Syntrophomonadaceae bacterium]